MRRHWIGRGSQSSMAKVHHESVAIEWSRLLRGFEGYQPDATIIALDNAGFVESLVDPPPGFVAAFLRQRNSTADFRQNSIKVLYAYLLQRRYEERLNLLYFAFHVFDEESRLPPEIIEQTPLPHEDGIPSYRYFGQPGFSLDPNEDCFQVSSGSE